MYTVTIGDLCEQMDADGINIDSTSEEIAISIAKTAKRLNSEQVPREAISNILLDGVKLRLKKKTGAIEEILMDNKVGLTGEWLLDTDTGLQVTNELNNITINNAEDVDKTQYYEDDTQDIETKIDPQPIDSDKDTLQETEETNMTPEEMLAKGLARLIQGNQTIKVEIGENTIKILESTFTKPLQQPKTDNQDTTVNKQEIKDSDETYTANQRNAEVVGELKFSKLNDLIARGMNIIYRGVPGCGKTFMANCDARAIIGKKESNRIKQIDFTENLDYSDTMVGLKQSIDGKWRYIKGEIARFCEFASQHETEKFVLILNEFTRANTEAVLGQMFTAMENKYRGKKFILDDGSEFVCPKNLIVLATMNGTDKGVKKLDKATEERFYIIDVKPLWEEWATDEESFERLIDKLEIKVNSVEYKLVKDLCILVASINEKCENGGILTADSQIGQRQLLQFVGQTDLEGNKILYDKQTLRIVVEQIISRAKTLVELNNSIASDIDKLDDLVGKCNEKQQ